MRTNANDFDNCTGLAELLNELTPRQLDFVEKRIFTETDAEAARQIDVIPGTVSRWKKDGAPLDEIVRLAKKDAVLVAAERLRRITPKAVRTIEEEMEKPRSSKRLGAAFGILDRVGIIKGQSVDVTSGGNALGQVVVYLPDKGRDEPASE